MTPKEKAEDLVNRFKFKADAYTRVSVLGNDIPAPQTLSLKNAHAKECALIAVNNIIAANPHSNPFNSVLESTMNYWLEVKQEIKKLYNRKLSD
jgi:hypothetical protein